MNIDKLLQPDPSTPGNGNSSAFRRYMATDSYPAVPWQLSWPNTFLSYNNMLVQKPQQDIPSINPQTLTSVDPLLGCMVSSRPITKMSRKNQGERRPRTTFSAEQTATLEEEYSSNEYISRSKRLRLAESLNLNEGQIKIWFQNRRAKDKRIEKAQMDNRLRYLTAMSMKNITTGGFSEPSNPEETEELLQMQKQNSISIE